MTIEVPDGSIYLWMYTQGLRQESLDDICLELARAGREIRPKDFDNYWNGWYRHELYNSERDIMVFGCERKAYSDEYGDYPAHPMLGQPEILNRWVPCSGEGKPLIKWSKGCLTKVDAMSMLGCRTLAENMKGTKMIVIDCDGDHDKNRLDLETIAFLEKFRDGTHCISKPRKCWEYGNIMDVSEARLLGMPASFHLTFAVDKVIPTMHFPAAHIDIIGNKANSLRYLKNKEWNGIDPAPMTRETWREIIGYVERRSSAWHTREA